MPQSPAVIGNLIQSTLGRAARVLDIREPAPDFLELDICASAPSGGWRPGHEVQFRVTPTQGRRYSVRTVDGTDSTRISILAATDSAGPGALWLRRLSAGTETTLLTGRHVPLRMHGERRVYLGDASAFGTIDAVAHAESTARVALEVPYDAVADLSARWPHYDFLPAQEAPGDALQAWLERATDAGDLDGIDGAVLLGHAQSLQRQRRLLVDSQKMDRRAITTKPYWATGREGL